MATSVIDMKLSWILDVADRVQSFFKPQSSELLNIVNQVAIKHGAVVAYNKIASSGYTFVIISIDPKQLLIDIINLIQSKKSKSFQTTLNPVNILVKLVDQEYGLDVNGIRLCYGIKASVASNALMKSFACRTIASVRRYYDYIDEHSGMLISDKIKEIHPTFDYNSDTITAIGGKKRKFKPVEKKKGNIRVNIVSRLIEYVRNNPTISQGIIFVNDLSESSQSPINILYTEYKFKEAIVDYLNLLTASSYTNYKFKSFLHADFNLPYDFKMRKYSCLLNDKVNKQPTYIANLYNIAEYEPVPCVKSVIQDTFIQFAHPIVKMRMIYVDMFMLEHKTCSTKHESVFGNRLLKIFAEVQTFDKSPTWIGYFIDEAYEKIKHNTKSRANTSIETFLV